MYQIAAKVGSVFQNPRTQFFNVDTDISDIETIYPEGLEYTPRRFAISKRTQWMVQQSDYVIAYVEHLSPIHI